MHRKHIVKVSQQRIQYRNPRNVFASQVVFFNTGDELRANFTSAADKARKFRTDESEMDNPTMPDSVYGVLKRVRHSETEGAFE